MHLSLQLKNITYSYYSRKALDNFSLDLRKGEIHALVGEHRAGKSTVVKLLGGIIKKQSGEIFIKNKKVESLTPISSMGSEIGIIYQDLNILPSLNAVENIYAGKFDVNWYRKIRFTEMRERIKSFTKKWNIDLNLNSPVSKLSVADQNTIEIIRAVIFEPEILIIDEISNRLNVDKIEFIYDLIHELRNRDRSIIYISNNMNEIFKFADRVSILKNGKVLSTQDIKTTDKVTLINLTYSFALTREELRKKNEELYNYKKYNEDIINNLPVGVMIVDTDREIYLTNTYIKEKLLTQNHYGISYLDKLLSAFNQELKDDIIRRMDLSETHTWEEIEYNENMYINISIMPFKDENYIPLGTIILIQDVSQDYYFKNYLIQSERISSIAELAAGVAHEVNNPLSIIINYVELLNRQKQDGYNREKLILMQTELNRIQSIIGSLLSFSHLKESPFTEVNIHKLIDEILLLTRHNIESKNIIIKKKFASTSVNIYGNENRLKQVLINILKNAIEAINEKGYIRIETVIYLKEGIFEMNFTNNGDTIPEEIISSIFNPFYSTKNDLKNTGLGLSICQHIIENHNGIITCIPSDKETTFSIKLPVSE